MRKWADLTISKTKSGLITFRHAAERYTREVLIEKSAASQKDNLRELKFLYMVFDDPPMPLDDITPLEIRQYLDWRVLYSTKIKADKNAARKEKGLPPIKDSLGDGRVWANREKALFSHIFNFARETGFTEKANPCGGVDGYEETGRDIHIDDDIFRIVWEVAEPHLRDAMDLAYLTALRPADVRKMSQSDIRGGAVSVR